VSQSFKEIVVTYYGLDINAQKKITFHDKLLKFYRSLGIWIKITSGNILITPVLGRSLENTVAVNITWTPNSEIARIEIRKSLYV